MRRPEAEIKKVLMIVGDAMRFDLFTPQDRYLMKVDRDTIQTPFLDRMAQDGVFFSNCFTCQPHTRAMYAMLSGLYPHRNGIRRFVGDSLKRVAGELMRELRADGVEILGMSHATAGLPFSGNWNLDGVDHFIGVFNKADRVFGMMMFLDTHWPYGRDIDDIVECRGDEKRFQQLYVEAFNNFDEKIQKIFEGIDDHDNVMVIVTADHGEILNERLAGHGGLSHEAVLRVPLFFYHHGMRGEVIPHQVRNIDIMPTINDLFGVEKLYPVDGVSMIGIDESRDAYFECVRVVEDPDEAYFMEQGLISGGAAYITGDDGDRIETYCHDLKSVYTGSDELLLKMRKKYERMEVPDLDDKCEQPNPEVVKRFRDLNYF